MGLLSYKKYIIAISIIIGFLFVSLGALREYSDYTEHSTWRPVIANVSHYDLFAQSSCSSGTCTHADIDYDYAYDGAQYSGHCCGSDVRWDSIQFQGLVNGHQTIEVSVNPGNPAESVISSVIFIDDAPFLIFCGLLVPFVAFLYFAVYEKLLRAKSDALGSIGPALQKNGFVKIPDYKEAWKGTYKNREFTVVLFSVGSLFEDVAVQLTSPNRTGGFVSIVLNSKKDMEAYKLGDIYERLDRIGLLSQIWRSGGSRVDFGTILEMAANKEGKAPWVLFNIDDKRASYILPGSLLNEKSFIESLDIICDTMDRLGT